MFNDGLIFDIRDNFGGYIKVAENIVQLFSSERISPLIFKLKVSPTNIFYWNTDPYFNLNHFRLALNSAIPLKQNYIELPLNDNDDTHALGQVYFKPVAVLNNALCYSACDMFSAKVQDYGAATIFGEDSTTGAGGANSWSYSNFFSQLPKDKKGPFIKLPLEMDIDFSYRQTVRTGKHSGELIENVGVLSDKIIKPTLDDLRNGSRSQYEMISKYLASRAEDYVSSINIINNNDSVEMNSLPSIKATWMNTNSVDFLVGDVVVASKITQETVLKDGAIPFPSASWTANAGTYTFEIVGRLNGKKVWRKVIEYTVKAAP
jgi:hypothetical protein